MDRKEFEKKIKQQKKFRQKQIESQKKYQEKRKESLKSKNKWATQKKRSAINTNMSKKKTRKKKPTRWKLVKKLDAIFSQYIRLLGTDKYWNCECVTCWDIKHWKEMQNGHFISRSNYKYRWDEKNCHVQCMRCNVFLSWNYINYTLFMQKYLWEDEVERMVYDKQLIKITTPEIEEMIEHYKKCVAELKEQKGL